MHNSLCDNFMHTWGHSVVDTHLFSMFCIMFCVSVSDGSLGLIIRDQEQDQDQDRDRDPIFFLSNIFLHEKHHSFSLGIFSTHKTSFFSSTGDIGTYHRLTAFFMHLFSFLPFRSCGPDRVVSSDEMKPGLETSITGALTIFKSLNNINVPSVDKILHITIYVYNTAIYWR